MHVASAPIPVARTLRPAEMLTAPSWVSQLSGLGDVKLTSVSAGIKCGVLRNADFCRVAVKIVRAVDLDLAILGKQTRLAYQAIFQSLGGFSPVRFWNFLPAIHQRMDDGQSRYMVFNAGRYQAFENHYGNHERFDVNVATASGVGHQAGELWIHCLAAREPAIHMGNPRQISPHRYSARYGKRPPCFARATYLAEQRMLLIGGTASICGEDSLHDNLSAQTNETLANLGHLITSACARCDMPCPADPLGCMLDLRVYHPRIGDAGWLQNKLRDRLPGVKQLTLEHSDLCRSELLVEIEGVAQLSPRDV